MKIQKYGYDGSYNQGELIKSVRLLRGFTQAELAEATGYSVAAISRWENSSRGIKLDELQKILYTLGYKLVVTDTFILEEEEDEC